MLRGYMTWCLTLSGSFISFLDFDLLVPKNDRYTNTIDLCNYDNTTHQCYFVAPIVHNQH